MMNLQSALPYGGGAALAEAGPKEIVLLHTDSALASIPFRENLEALAASCAEWYFPQFLAHFVEDMRDICP